MKGGSEGGKFDRRWARPCQLAVGLGVFGNSGQNPSQEVPVAWFLWESFLDMTSCSILIDGATC